MYVIGDGPERKKLEEKIEKYNLKEFVFLEGYKKNVGDYLESADIFVHPSYAEGFGIAVAEAMFAKKPIIVSNTGALPELIQNGVTGLIADPFSAKDWIDKIEYLLNNKDKAKKFAETAYIYAKDNFNINKYVNEYLNFYKEVLNEKN